MLRKKSYRTCTCGIAVGMMVLVLLLWGGAVSTMNEMGMQRTNANAGA